jgi:hypothetical protein
MACERGTLVNGRFDRVKQSVISSGYNYSEDIFKKATVTLYYGGMSKVERVSCHATVESVMDGTWKYLLYRDISNPAEKAAFVVKTVGGRKVLIGYWYQGRLEGKALKTVEWKSQLRDIWIGPYMVAHLAESLDASQLMQHPIFQEKHRPWLIVKPCPHVARTADDAALLRLPLGANDGLQPSSGVGCDDMLPGLENDDLFKELGKGVSGVTYHGLRADDENTVLQVLYLPPPQRLRNNVMYQACNQSGCQKAIKASLRDVAGGSGSRTAILDEIFDFQMCRTCWPVAPDSGYRLKIHGDGQASISPPHTGNDAVLMVTVIKSGILEAYAYKVHGSTVNGPCARLAVKGRSQGKFAVHRKAEPSILDLLKRGGDVRVVMEKFWTEMNRFSSSNDKEMHDCGLACTDETTVRRASTSTAQASAQGGGGGGGGSSAKAVAQQYIGIGGLEDDAKRMVKFFESQEAKDDGRPFSISNKTIKLHVSSNMCLGLDEDEPLYMDIDTSEDALARFDAFVPTLWEATGRDDPGLIKERIEAGGSWAVLIQGPDQLEVVVALPYRRNTVVPKLGFRLPGKQTFSVWERDSSVRIGLLGLHLDTTRATIFRFPQNSGIRRELNDWWLRVVMDVKTGLARKPSFSVQALKGVKSETKGKARAKAKASSRGQLVNPRGGKLQRTHADGTSSKFQWMEPDEEEVAGAQGAAAEVAASADVATGAATTFTDLVNDWPLEGKQLITVLSFYKSKEINSTVRDVTLKLLQKLGVVSEDENETLSHHVLHHVHCMILPQLPPSYLNTWRGIAAVCQEQTIAHEHNPQPWGMGMMMRVVPWVNGVYNDHKDMTEWDVQVPTEAQLTIMAADKKMELLARLLGFGFWFVNCIGTSPINTYHEAYRLVLGHVSMNRTKTTVMVADVLKSNRETKSHKELHTYARAIFDRCLDVIVGWQGIVEIERSLRCPLETGVDTLDLCREAGDLMRGIASRISYVGARFLYQPVLDTTATVESIQMQTLRRHMPVWIAGYTGSGKTTTVSMLKNTVWHTW